MQTTIREFISFFRKEFGISLSPRFIPNEELIPLEEYMYGSLSAKDHVYLTQGDIDDFISSENKGYFLIGFWGHGANSYAVYYRGMMTGAMYISDFLMVVFTVTLKKIKKRIRKFLKNYFAFEPELKSRAKSLIAIDSMGVGDYRIELLDGRTVSVEEIFISYCRFHC